MTYATVSAQGWEKVYGDSLANEANDLTPTADGGWFMVGSSDRENNDLDVYLLKTDVDGSEQWHRYLGTAGNQELANALAPVPGGGYVLAGISGNGNNFSGSVWRTDALGNEMWSYTSPYNFTQFESVSISPDTSVLLAGKLGDSTFYLTKLDADGNEIWNKQYPGNDIRAAFKIIGLSDGSFLVAGYSHFGMPNLVNGYLGKFDSDGNIIWEKDYGGTAEEQFLSMEINASGDIFLVGFRNDNSAMDNTWIVKTNSDGDLIFEKEIPLAGIQAANDIQILADGSLIIVGQTSVGGAPNNAFLLHTDADGNIIWNKTYGGLEPDNGKAVIALPDASLAFCGFTESFGAGAKDAWLVRTDANGNSLSSIITGNVFQDFDLNGLPSVGEPGIEDWLIIVEGTNTYYTSSDETGFYSIAVDTGNYITSLVIPNPYWLAGQNDVPVSIQQLYDTTEILFPVEKTSDCSFLTIDVGTPFLRRCFSNIYSVMYCNEGTMTALGASAQLQLDPYLTLDSASVNFTDLGGNLFAFDLGDLDPFDCGDIKLYTTVDCDSTLLGQTHCIEARIFPDTFCTAPDPGWDGSSLDLEAVCSHDTVKITIKNTGSGNMAARTGFIIIEDDVLTKTGTVQVGSGMDTLITIPTEGETVRFEISQANGHPGNSSPSISVEGCGAFPYSIGFVNQFPMDDGDNFVEIDCRENIGAYDPNDKLGFPKGYSFLHYIEPNGDLEYLIRFQNTGTDTAFTVVIRDTLPEELDIKTIRPGAASHAYDFDVSGNGVIKFTFNNILLVDSFTNEPGSHGFVKFRIAQVRDLLPNTLINNDASIYFDFNPPIVTPETDHLIASNFIKIDTSTNTVNIPGYENAWVKIAPNPFSTRTRITIENTLNNKSDCFFVLYNSMGQILKKEVMKTSELEFNRGNLPSGHYFFRLIHPAGDIASGKIILQ
jgi:uncharacterized repeat protein (TIGR01451 family)